KPDGPSTRTIRRLGCYRPLLPSPRRGFCCIIFSPRFLWQPPFAAPLGLRPRLLWAWDAFFLSSFASLGGGSPWSDGLPPSPSSSSCRWFSRQGPTRRLGRTGTQRGR